MTQLDPPKKPDPAKTRNVHGHLDKVFDGFRAAVFRKRQERSSGSVGNTVQWNGEKGGSGPVGDS